MNIMVCGPAGIGKTSFVKMFLEKFDSEKARELIKIRSKHNKKDNKPIIEGPY